MQKSIVYVEEIHSTERKESVAQRLHQMIGVKNISIDTEQQSITIQYETPSNLNTLEKEIYDAGITVIRTEKGEMQNG
ncbi:putative copper chaperone CsoZ [Staphylococcus chromogenes]|uniref:putative copper chaperone CsoZ n=1 Tax=Staphylococcus chromogenes TaxID=46126 RepID=UPI0021D1968F|nr:heavy metal-associated domain-containing protein [Staphylococcus chromogenes]UXS76132.1 heavy-metal-associated domain-containing protein [Staphylococcus chromogenes]